jgi:hypothetical protein
MENDARQQPDRQPAVTVGPAIFVRTVTAVAIVAFALLVVADGRRMMPFALGIVGLIFVGAALMAIDGFGEEWRRSYPARDDSTKIDIMTSVPLLVEAGLWALAALYVIQLVEIARG